MIEALISIALPRRSSRGAQGCLRPDREDSRADKRRQYWAPVKGARKLYPQKDACESDKPKNPATRHRSQKRKTSSSSQEAANPNRRPICTSTLTLPASAVLRTEHQKFLRQVTGPFIGYRLLVQQQYMRVGGLLHSKSGMLRRQL